jgi:ParB-like chromosome segregation protein Spo0J
MPGRKTKKWEIGAIPIFLHPDEYAEQIPVARIVADKRVIKEGVERYKKLFKKTGDLGTIIVVRHPRKELYAVLDGHHRFWALKELGVRTIKCAVIQDYYGLTFILTEKGFYQPTAEFTKQLRIPILRWGEGLLSYLEEFKKDPLSMLGERLQRKPKKKGKEPSEDELI